jgi:hypothetical protein
VLTDVENNGTQGARGFILVQASQRIIALSPMCVGCTMIAWVEIPSTPLLYAKGVGFTWKIRSVMVVPDPDIISTCPIYKI